MTRIDTDVIIVGAGPAGLMLAAELRLAGVRSLVLERRTQRGQTPKAGGLGGQILQLLHYRGLTERFVAASPDPNPAPKFPFGGVHVDLTQLEEAPMHAMVLSQVRLEELLDERATELGAELRRGHEVVRFSQDDDTVTAEVSGPDGPYQLTARYLVGCDGGRSRVRGLAGIAFPGTTYPEVQRLGQITVHPSVTDLGNDLEVPGLGRIAWGYTRTDRGVFALGRLSPDVLMVSTTEDESTEYDDNAPLTLTELEDSISRVLGGRLPLGEPRRLSRFTFKARQADRYREGRVLLAGDAAHLFPATGVGLNAGMLDSVNLAWKLAASVQGWAPAGLVDTYHQERQLAGARTMLHTQAQVALRRGDDAAADALREVFLELLGDEQPLRRMGALIAGADIRYPVPNPNQHALTGTFAPDLTLRTGQGTIRVGELTQTARPIFLDLADRPELREVAHSWRHRVDLHTAKTGDRPADALLIRPDAHIAWAATVDEPAGPAVLALREALTNWFGAPLMPNNAGLDQAS